jgi:hypothetical protein
VAVVLLIAGAAGPAGASQVPVASDHEPPDCEVDGRDAELESRAGQVTYVSPMANGSTADWDGGRIIRVGASGDCSLAATNGTATLAGTAVGTPGLVTGTVDLGANGSFRLVGPDGRSRLALRNDGPAYATSVAVVVDGTVRERLRTPTGRFFHVTVRRDTDGTTRLAVWDHETTWDGQWDAEFGDTAAGEQWRVGLRAEAFLDEIAVGTPDPPTPTPAPTTSGTPAPSGSDDDPLPGEDGEFPPPEFEDGDADRGGSVPPDDGSDGGSSGDTAFLAVLMIVGGGLGFRFAYAVSQFEERVDAIGSTTPWHEVEPADWKVLLNRIVFGGLAIAGLLWLASIVL